DQRDDVASGNIPMIDDDEAGAIETRFDAYDRARWNRGPDGAAVQQAGEREIVEIARGAGHLLDALLAEDVPADRPRGARHGADYMRRYAVFFNRRSSMPTTARSSPLSEAAALDRSRTRARSVAIVAPSM